MAQDLVNPQSQRTTWTYDAARRVTLQQLANGTRTSSTYDDAGQLQRMSHIGTGGGGVSSMLPFALAAPLAASGGGTSGIFADFQYTYDPAGNRTRVIEVNGDRVTFTYDNTNQLKTEQRSGANAYHITHTYDPVGNCLVKNDSGARTTWTYDNANQIINQQDADGTTNFTFDANGNQAVQESPGGRTTYTWDFENRMTSAALPSGARNTFQYDPDGRRIRKEDSTGTAKIIWDQENALVETDQSDVTQAVYTLEPQLYGNLISQNRGGAARFYHFDALGSTARLTSSAQAVTDSYVYEGFGKIQSSSGTSNNPYRFVGQLGYYFDTDLMQHYIRARHYVPSLARFLSQDDLRDWDISQYAYSANSPILFADPSGLAWIRTGRYVKGECRVTGRYTSTKPHRPHKRGRLCVFVCECPIPPPGYLYLKSGSDLPTHLRPCTHPPSLFCAEYKREPGGTGTVPVVVPIPDLVPETGPIPRVEFKPYCSRPGLPSDSIRRGPDWRIVVEGIAVSAIVIGGILLLTGVGAPIGAGLLAGGGLAAGLLIVTLPTGENYALVNPAGECGCLISAGGIYMA